MFGTPNAITVLCEIRSSSVFTALLAQARGGRLHYTLGGLNAHRGEARRTVSEVCVCVCVYTCVCKSTLTKHVFYAPLSN